MALDLTLCLVPKQIESLFAKAVHNHAYAAWMQFIPSLLVNSDAGNHQEENYIAMKNDVAALKKFYRFTEEHYFYDESRCSSTIDYLLKKRTSDINPSIETSLLWEGGNKFPNISPTQGVPIKLYDKKQIEKISLVLIDLEFSDLISYYDYDKMRDIGVYKLTRPDNLSMLELAFYKIQDLFLLALAEDLLLFKVID